MKEFGNLSTNKGSRDNAFKVAKLLKAQNQDIICNPCLKDDRGCKERLKAWKKHYEKLLNKEFDWDESHLIMDSPVEGPAPWILKPVVIKALARMKDAKAAGCSGVVAEMLKASGENGFSTITQLFNSIINESKIPEDWNRSIILNCFKGKGDAMERGNYLLYGTETWPARTEDTYRLVTTEKDMIHWMCGAPKDNSISSSELRSKTGVTSRN